MFYILLYTFPHSTEFHVYSRDGKTVMVPAGQESQLAELARDYQDKKLFGTCMLCSTNGLPL